MLRECVRLSGAATKRRPAYARVVSLEIAARGRRQSILSTIHSADRSRQVLAEHNVLPDSAYDASRLLKQSLVVPSTVDLSQLASHPIVLAYEQSVQAGKAKILRGARVSALEALERQVVSAAHIRRQ